MRAWVLACLGLLLAIAMAAGDPAPAGEVPMKGKVVAGGLLVGTWTPAASRSACPVVWVVAAAAP